MSTINLDSFLADLGKFTRVTNEVDAEAHGKVASALGDAAKVVIPLLPDGPAVESILTQFKSIAALAHGALTTLDAAKPAAPESVLHKVEGEVEHLLGHDPAPVEPIPAPVVQPEPVAPVAAPAEPAPAPPA